MDNSFFKGFNSRNKHLLIMAKTRTGVTSSIIIPAILENSSENFLILDFNNEIFFITAKYRKNYGNVYLIDKNTTMEEINKIDYSGKFTIYICCEITKKNINEIRIFENILKILDNKKIKCMVLIEHFENIVNILKDFKIGNNSKFLISAQENSNLEIIKNDLGKFDTGYIKLSENLICVDDKEYKQDFYFKNKNYIKKLKNEVDYE